MDIAQLVPGALPVPAPVHLLEVLLLATFVVHLLLMNTVLGGAIIALVGELFGRKNGNAAALGLSKKMPANLALTVNFGVAPLLFTQVLFGQFLYTGCILSAWYWLAVILLVILAYYGLYLYDFKYAGLSGLRPLVLAAAVLLLLDTAFIFVNVMTLSQSPADWTAYFDNPGGTLLHLSDPTLWPRFLHFVAGSIAVGGLFSALLAQRKYAKAGADAPQKREQIAWGMRWFTLATLAQFGIGTWFFLSLPREIMTMMLGRSGPLTSLLWAGVGMSLVSLYFGLRKEPKTTAISVVLTVGIMACIRHLVRLAYLAPYFSLTHLKTHPQLSPLLLFLASLAIVIPAIFWMLKQAVRAGRSENKEGQA